METKGVRDSSLASASKVSRALEGRKDELVTIKETRVEAGEAWALVVESSMWITKLATKAKTAVAKVKQVVVLAIGVVEGREARPWRVFPSLARFVYWGWIGALDF